MSPAVNLAAAERSRRERIRIGGFRVLFLAPIETNGGALVVYGHPRITTGGERHGDLIPRPTVEYALQTQGSRQDARSLSERQDLCNRDRLLRP